MDLLADLNPQQRLAVEHGRGPALVLAGAGSGKTRVIAYRIAYLIQNSAARPENILAVTFTNKAAREMRERVQKIVGASRSAEPLISTFHSFCVRLLRREIHHAGYHRDFSIYDTDDQKRLIRRILNEMFGQAFKIAPREIISRISYAKNHGVAPDGYADYYPSQTAAEIQDIYRQYNTRLRNANALDFDDLLLVSVALLKKSEKLRKYYSDWYRFILVDEYQDTNRPQYELLRLLTESHSNLFVVGDEDQSIYKFRGADIQNILKFEKDFPGARIIKLEQNYRSSANILRAAGSVVENNTERKGKVLWTDRDSGDIITCTRAESAREEAAWAAQKIQGILDENPEWRIAILYRANSLSRNFEDVLIDKGIPYAVVGSVGFFGRAEVKDLLAYLRILFNPGDDIALLRILNTPPRGIGKTTVEMLTKMALEKRMPILQAVREAAADPQSGFKASRALSRFQKLMDKWIGMRDASSASGLLKTILADIAYADMLRKQESAAEAENRMANIEELIRAAEESQGRGESVSEFLDRASLSSELDQLDPDARVSLMTLHSAKGLEFDAVFMVGMEDGLFPHSQSMGSKEELEEERRLCYVGITRAKQKLFLSWTPYRKAYGSEAGFACNVSRFLKEMPQDLMEGLDSFSYDLSEQRAEQRNRFFKTNKKPPREFVAEELKIRGKAFVQPKSIAELKAYLQQMHKSTGAQEEDAKSGVLFKAGTRVRHEQFGDGIVLSRERMGKEIKLVVAFSRVGKKSLMERYANLTRL